MQMTGTHKETDALSGRQDKWKSINWAEAELQVKRLQMRIAKAVKI